MVCISLDLCLFWFCFWLVVVFDSLICLIVLFDFYFSFYDFAIRVLVCKLMGVCFVVFGVWMVWGLWFIVVCFGVV